MMAATMSMAAADSGLWRIRALALAEERHLIGTARLIWTKVYGREVWTEPSWAHKGEVHQVRGYTTSGRIHCDCPSTRAYSHHCAVFHAERMREQATR